MRRLTSIAALAYAVVPSIDKYNQAGVADDVGQQPDQQQPEYQRVLRIRAPNTPLNPSVTTLTTSDNSQVSVMRCFSSTGIDLVIASGGTFPETAVIALLPKLPQVYREWPPIMQVLQDMCAYASGGGAAWELPEDFYLIGTVGGAVRKPEVSYGAPDTVVAAELLESLKKLVYVEPFPKEFWAAMEEKYEKDAGYLKNMAIRALADVITPGNIGVLGSECTMADLDEAVSKTSIADYLIPEMRCIKNKIPTSLFENATRIASSWLSYDSFGRYGRISCMSSGRKCAHLLVPITEGLKQQIGMSLPPTAPIEGRDWWNLWRYALTLQHIARSLGLKLRVTCTPMCLCFTGKASDSAEELANRAGKLFKAIRDKQVPEQLINAISKWIKAFPGQETIGGSSVTQREQCILLPLFSQSPAPTPVAPSKAELESFVTRLPLAMSVFLEPANKSRRSESRRNETDIDKLVMVPGVSVEAKGLEKHPSKLIQLLETPDSSLEISTENKAVVVREMPQPGSEYTTAVPLPHITGAEWDQCFKLSGTPSAPVELQIRTWLPELHKNKSVSESDKEAVRMVMTCLLAAAGKQARSYFLLPHLTQIDAAPCDCTCGGHTVMKHKSLWLRVQGQSDSLPIAVRNIVAALETMHRVTPKEFERAKEKALQAISNRDGTPFYCGGSLHRGVSISDLLIIGMPSVRSVVHSIQSLTLNTFKELIKPNEYTGGCSLFNNAVFDFYYRGTDNVALELINLIRNRVRWVNKAISFAEHDELKGSNSVHFTRLGSELKNNRKVLCVDYVAADDEDYRTTMIISGSYPRNDDIISSVPGGILLMKQCLLSILHTLNVRDPSIETYENGDEVLFFLSGKGVTPQKLNEAIEHLAAVDFTSAMVLNPEKSKQNAQVLEQRWPLYERLLDSRVADRLRWTMVNQSVRMCLTNQTTPLSDWQIVGSKLVEKFPNLPVHRTYDKMCT